ncbi:MAG: penicillin-binding protein 1C [Bacteroidetes bacterium]|nr:penicillin-binding protein 1C [Bacteroidota bacterium]
MRRFFTIKRIIYSTLIFALGLWFLCCLPDPLFSDSYSTLLKDREGNLLSAEISEDGQWRFPQGMTLNPKFRECVVLFEDQYFYAHQGINPASIWRAFRQNQKAGKVVSGGSTITMQLIRLIRKNKPREYSEKILEMIMALRIELSHSKNDILNLYAAHAPFGSNVVGIDAASWRYFGRTSDKLSWAECATLAVLPNAPSLIYPGKNQEKLLEKRNRLLWKLYANKRISTEDLQLALQEPLPQKPFPLPNKARHLLNRCVAEGGRGRIYSTSIDGDLQDRLLEIVKRSSLALKNNEIHNMAVLVLDVKKNEVVSYIGNTPLKDKEPHGEDVDVIAAPRSTGSLLKPYLYGFMLNDGDILPNSLVADVPTQVAGYTPQNYDLTYDGAVPAKRALSRSLNIPAVKMLQQYGIEKFADRLRQLGLTTIDRSADDYGLSLILGGAEGKLWDMCSAYGSMARTLTRYNRSGTYSSSDWEKPVYMAHDVSAENKKQQDALIRAGSVWLTFEAMAEVSRPDIDASWQRLGSSQKVAWKTGTSFGFRDGWAIGVTPDYVVGVWVGNADGEGRPGLTGISTAAPVLFSVFGQLPRYTDWFRMPVSDLNHIKVCENSGCRPSDICPKTKYEWVPKQSEKSAVCSYHKWVHLDAKKQYQVTDACVMPADMVTVPWFVLPPVQEYYYKSRNPTYVALPPFRPGCAPQAGRNMEMIYPKSGTLIYVPTELNGEQGKAIFEAAHREPGRTIFWHLDGALAGTTKDIHQLAVNPTKGKHYLNLTDDAGESLTVLFEVMSEKK